MVAPKQRFAAWPHFGTGGRSKYRCLGSAHRGWVHWAESGLDMGTFKCLPRIPALAQAGAVVQRQDGGTQTTRPQEPDRFPGEDGRTG